MYQATAKMNVFLIISLVLVACASQPEEGTSQTGPSSIIEPDEPFEGTQVSVNPVPMPEEGDLGTPSEVKPGEVTITVIVSAFANGELITATIANGLDETIYTTDTKSDCSIAILEVLEGDDWVTLIGCGMERSPIVWAIGSGRSRTVILNPFSTHFGSALGDSQPAIGEGTYRIVYTYRLEPGREGEESLSAISDIFEILP